MSAGRFRLSTIHGDAPCSVGYVLSSGDPDFRFATGETLHSRDRVVPGCLSFQDPESVRIQDSALHDGRTLLMGCETSISE